LLELILGGARSGKSALAERLAMQQPGAVCYIATATADDEEMQRRITAHRQRRPDHWQTVEEPIALAQALLDNATDDNCIIVDCLTLWLSNLLLEQQDHLQRQLDHLLMLLPTLPGHQILVSNEVGLGIVPMGELTRRLQDQAGWLHQALAAQADRVIFTVAGLPHILKGEPL